MIENSFPESSTAIICQSVGLVSRQKTESCDPSQQATVHRAVTLAQVHRDLNRIDTWKVTNSEDYLSWITKHNSEFLCETKIINAMFTQCQFPNIWKLAEIVPVPKVPNPTQLSELLPISLLFHCGKVAEKLFVMVEYKKEVLPKLSSSNQFAYSTNVGTMDAIIHAIEIWYELLDKRPNAEVGDFQGL